MQLCVGLCRPSWPESKTSGEVQPDGVTNREREGKAEGRFKGKAQDQQTIKHTSY